MTLISRRHAPAACLTRSVTICLLLSGCAAAVDDGSPFAALEAARIPPPPGAPDGSCWAQDATPAVLETVTEQVMVRPALNAPDGTMITPAEFTTETRQEIVTPRRTIRFETVCAADITPQFVASVQRALQARGLYDGPITGTFNRETNAALRLHQSTNGQQTGFLTMQTARDFGLAPALW